MALVIRNIVLALLFPDEGLTSAKMVDYKNVWDCKKPCVFSVAPLVEVWHIYHA